MIDTTAPVSTAPAPSPAPTVAPTVTGELSQAQASQMAGWIRDDLAKGKLSPEKAAKAFDQLGATPEQRAGDTRSEAAREVDAMYGLPAKPEEFLVRLYPPGQEPREIPKEVSVFEGNVRGWMSDAGLSKELGYALFNTLSKAIQHTHALTPEQREAYKDSENAKMGKLFGPDWHDTKLQPVAVMIHELDQKRPGLKELVRAHGDHAMFLAQLIQAARVYHARKR